jgi:hypothetical protein
MTRTELLSHRSWMYHDVLAHGPEYRRLLDLACAEFDAWVERGKTDKKKGRPKKLKPLAVDRRKERAA